MATIRFDCFEVDPAGLQLRKHGSRIRLREQSFHVLAMLLERPGQLVTRDELQHRLWPNGVIVDFENNLNTAIGRLREALGDSVEHPRFIETVPRHGYRFIASMVAPADAVGQARLLVLPFVNSSGDASQEYLSDAMTDELIAELSALAPARLAVIARTTAMCYKATRKDIAQIGCELQLDYVVEGSVRRADGRVALTVQLVRVHDQAHVLARRYDTEVSAISEVQQSVAQELGEHVGIVPTGEAQIPDSTARPRPPRKLTRDPAAYNSYILGRYHFDKGESPEFWTKARECFEDAIARDPQFAVAYDALAELWWTAGFFGSVPPKKALSVGIVHAMRAVEIESDLAEAHAMLAQYLKQLDYNWAEVQREMALALELNPASPIVLMRSATTALMPFGRIDEAVEALERALEVDPLAMFPRMWLEVMLWLGRRYDEAIEQGRRVLELAPSHFIGHFTIGLVYREAGRFEEAIAAHRKAAEFSRGAPLMLGWLGFALAESGDHAGARAILARLRAMPAGVYAAPTSFAWIHLGLGEIDDFFEWMDKSVEGRDHMIMPIKTYPFLDRIRDDPRYAALLRKMNLT